MMKMYNEKNYDADISISCFIVDFLQNEWCHNQFESTLGYNFLNPNRCYLVFRA